MKSGVCHCTHCREFHDVCLLVECMSVCVCLCVPVCVCVGFVAAATRCRCLYSQRLWNIVLTASEHESLERSSASTVLWVSALSTSHQAPCRATPTHTDSPVSAVSRSGKNAPQNRTGSSTSSSVVVPVDSPVHSLWVHRTVVLGLSAVCWHRPTCYTIQTSDVFYLWSPLHTSCLCRSSWVKCSSRLRWLAASSHSLWGWPSPPSTSSLGRQTSPAQSPPTLMHLSRLAFLTGGIQTTHIDNSTKTHASTVKRCVNCCSFMRVDWKMVQLSIQLLHVIYTHRDSRYCIIILLFVLLLYVLLIIALFVCTRKVSEWS